MNEKTMKFTDEQGNKVEYAILDPLHPLQAFL